MLARCEGLLRCLPGPSASPAGARPPPGPALLFSHPGVSREPPHGSGCPQTPRFHSGPSAGAERGTTTTTGPGPRRGPGPSHRLPSGRRAPLPPLRRGPPPSALSPRRGLPRGRLRWAEGRPAAPRAGGDERRAPGMRLGGGSGSGGGRLPGDGRRPETGRAGSLAVYRDCRQPRQRAAERPGFSGSWGRGPRPLGRRRASVEEAARLPRYLFLYYPNHKCFPPTNFLQSLRVTLFPLYRF